MPRELKDVNITHVSYVDKGANQKRFFLKKSDDGDSELPSFDTEVKLLVQKEDNPEQLIYGIVYEPDVPDSHDDYMTSEEIEKAAHSFIQEYRNVDTQHNFEKGAGEVVESYIAPQDFEVDGETIVKGSWVLVTKATDEVWEAVEKGEITGYSMAGTAGEVVEKEQEKQPHESEEDQQASFFKAMKNFFMKGEVEDNYNKQKPFRDVRSALNTFEDIYFECVYWSGSDEIDYDRLAEAARDLGSLLTKLGDDAEFMKKSLEKSAEQPIEKAGKKISADRMKKLNQAYESLSAIIDEVEEAEEEETEVKKEEFESILKDAFKPVEDRLTNLEKQKEDGSDDDDQKDVKKDEGKDDQPEALTAEDITKAVQKAVEPLEERLETVEKARGIQKGEKPEEEEEEVEKNDGDDWKGLL